MRSSSQFCAPFFGLLIFASSALAEPLVRADWLQDEIGGEDLVVLDIRNKIDGGSAEAFAEGHIPGAVYSNYLQDGWRVEVDGIPGMTPEVTALEALIGGLGIDNQDNVIIVHGGTNATDFGSAARVYWTFKYLGHDAVSVLDGGYRHWTADADRPIEQGPSSPEPANFVADVQSDYLVDTETVAATLDDPRVVRIDARPEQQYLGDAKHPAAREAGRIPGSHGVDNALAYNPETGKLHDAEHLAKLVPPAVASGEADIVVSYCNTGHWAATNWFVLSEVLGHEQVKLYDASMCGWAADPANVLETGDSELKDQSHWAPNKS